MLDFIKIKQEYLENVSLLKFVNTIVRITFNNWATIKTKHDLHTLIASLDGEIRWMLRLLTQSKNFNNKKCHKKTKYKIKSKINNNKEIKRIEPHTISEKVKLSALAVKNRRKSKTHYIQYGYSYTTKHSVREIVIVFTKTDPSKSVHPKNGINNSSHMGKDFKLVAKVISNNNKSEITSILIHPKITNDPITNNSISKKVINIQRVDQGKCIKALGIRAQENEHLSNPLIVLL